MIPKATRGVRGVVIGSILLAVLFIAYKGAYTDVPPERLAVYEMIRLADPVRLQASETFQDFGTLEGHMDGLIPAAQVDEPNSKGPFEWEVRVDGSILGRSTRYAVRLEYTTADQGQTWRCQVEPKAYAPSVGPCKAAQ